VTAAARSDVSDDGVANEPAPHRMSRKCLAVNGYSLPWVRRTEPTVCPGWDVHDVVGHVLNDYMRRLSGSRDGYAGAVFADDDTLPTYLARTNDDFVRASRRLSPRLLTDLLERLGTQLYAVWSTRDLHAPADLDVSWAASD
jgi:hypothetical protein